MAETRGPGWLPAATLVALGYAISGLVTAALARAGGPGQRTLWRFAAWGLGAVIFALHLARERRRAGTPAVGAWHACVAVALGTCAIAAAAIVHNLTLGPLRPAMFAAFVVWPLLTGVTSFLVACVVLFAWFRITRSPSVS